MPIITTAQYKTYAGISGTAQDARLNIIIPGIQAMIEGLTGRKFDLDDQIEYFDGKWQSSLQLMRIPIDEIDAVSLVDIDRTVLYTYPDTQYTAETETGILSQRVSDNSMQVTGTGDCGGWGTATGGNNSTYTIGDAPVFPNSVFRGVKVTYSGGYADPDMPLDLQLLMYDMVATQLATINADMSMKSETLGHYRYERNAGSWVEQFMTRINAWSVFS